MTKRILLVMFAFLSITLLSAQDVRYYKLTRKEEGGKSSTNVSGGQFITFVSDMCFESNKNGVGVGHGTMTKNKTYSNTEYTTYQGSSYWGKKADYMFNADKSVLNVVLENGDVYIYKRATAPAGQETCSLIRKSGGGGGTIVVTPPPVIVNPNTPTPSPTPTPTPKPKHTCSLCRGTGRTIKTNGISFGNTKYCSECGKTVPDNHYHSNCESCGGKGWW